MRERELLSIFLKCTFRVQNMLTTIIKKMSVVLLTIAIHIHLPGLSPLSVSFENLTNTKNLVQSNLKQINFDMFWDLLKESWGKSGAWVI